MADHPPPDTKRGPGKKRGGKSGKVADFRYKRPSRPDGKRSDRRNPPRRDAGFAARAPAVSATHSPQPHRQAYAALDLGTNNCRLLIARPSGENFTVIDAFSRVVRLGEGLAASGRLSDESMERTLAALHVCAEKLRRRNVRLARSVATEACRRACNGPAFIERVRRETGIMLDIISAQEEARLAVLGCHILLEEGDGPAIIFDIGGGSTELVLVQPGDKVPRIVDWLSVPWGVVSLTDTVQGSDASEASRLERYAGMRQTVSASFAEFAERIRKHTQSREPIRLLGTSGTVTTLASLHLELPQYDRRAVDGLIVPSQAMRDISTRLSRMSAGDRKCLPCIGDDRANLVIAGCAILESILDIWPAEQLGVADRGIREGILRSLIAADAEGERSRAALQRMREQDV
ncbi:MAG: Ppx/GppA phosphatase family protein [Qipengyuania citrea]|jgi:exopolyphosphatase/guanosine-5'-triphosphate,3'-diphosphate pyrophosphatase|uniref:Ppx/GppA phosphatase family protein n=1 Tax=Erythrobacteraceae TaxID=335929 RepID=UPI0007B9DBDA|nr:MULTISPECIES: Ppx/GppA phosphatase family protein [unclassified Erythrobacter]HAN89885.1 Ppx/GppA family phosphatase [Erythrobacter sp.]KZY95127.1 exopolyphosphatase [Erythrobacter sp. HI0074]KZZ05869.1 exopolyphosphatase [Erythrobacter sp. HI0077]HAV79339.1 Ppx/GppA family phosphatase [Erythrobacter sp.]HBM04700.1 Ppx/GppA family phosphatase [Erythrobacter sp.]|tara:strand:+ start:1759 stop:2973 length:1215 start_codon:yes stop_codon:yes gene_type:complete